uniref:Uncharacterized protein n=1 Tax=Setaria italica TaxID=4555 RepID=K3ZC73_SETIT
MVSPIQVLYEVKNASSIIKMLDSGTSYGVSEECNIDEATEEKGDEVSQRSLQFGIMPPENMGAWESSSSLETPYQIGSLHPPNIGSGS